MIPLRPLGLGDVLGGAFTVFRRNARVLLLWSVLLSGVLGLLSTLVSTFGQQALQSRMLSAVDGGSGSESIAAGSFTLWLVLSAGLPFLAFLGRGFLVAPVAADTGQRILGRRATFRGIWALLAGRRRSVVAWILLQLAAGAVVGIVFVLVMVGFIAALTAGRSNVWGFVLAILGLLAGFAVVVIWLGTRFAFTVPTIALEGRTVFAAAAQSWRLTRGSFWRTFGILLLVQAMFGFAVSIASFPLTIGAVLIGGTFDPLGQTDASTGLGVAGVVAVVVGSLLGIAVQCITDVLSASVTTFLAVDRRIRTEALDQRIASHLETGQPTDPFAPAPQVVRPPWPGQQQWPGQQPWPAQQQWPGQQPTPQQQWPGQQPAPQQPPPEWGGAPDRYPPDGRA
ncbi:glycerophosphoryl diester phosphodiesterase membrane domain-containing protein [Curtobacterium sp. MCPF17_002]|uniref:glycerophosphoryl diester phosphodiesterase membrane domain-containing protein n=1 Tax=Curtobacterium sp. MCPF17_002 TaxID=2175645 RepID=UPI0015E8B63A|nr:glycerophosphoryl diester phosphodiesterase membrane domain-containing protein [Curtobacterium sp. MCPF17_002]WIB76323.1 glycerophosphoryl diester phosphodiesterase membrane domain-containing protein [Curtobacterium sp. MCPF17_002]